MKAEVLKDNLKLLEQVRLVESGNPLLMLSNQLLTLVIGIYKTLTETRTD